MDTSFNRPTLVTITAPTCSGKSYLLNMMTKEQPLFSRIVSTTTREPREGEQDGVDYFYITHEKSEQMEVNGLFAELIEFRGTRYGVTKKEMQSKMAGKLAPIVILEPRGLEIYKRLCIENGWDIFKIYVSTLEATRVERLNERTAFDVSNAIHSTHKEPLCRKRVEKLIKIHTDRLLSITRDERYWLHTNSWDVIVSGDDAATAIKDITQAIKWRNYQNDQLNT